MDAEVNRYIIMNEGKGLVPGYPQSMLDMMGKWNIAAVHGPQHKAMRSAMLNLISPTAIRDQLLPKIDEFMRSFIRSWSDRVIDIQEESKEVGRFINSITSVVSMLEKLMEERRASPSSRFDMLDSLLRPDDPAKPKLSDEQIIDLILTLIYSGFETVSTTTMMSVKYLHDDPKVLEELRVP
ncbi:hypothetical protein GW17_00055759 [Ensete ventricosum]|nr:hypothetical protein GW17_00055759 [Ensete ventricosum]